MLKNWGVCLDFKVSGACSFERKVIKNQSKNEVEYRHRFLIDFLWIFGPILEPKSFQNRFRSGFGRALEEDSVSKLKKERAKCIRWTETGRFLGFRWEGNREGTGSFTRLATCPRTGVGELTTWRSTEIDLTDMIVHYPIGARSTFARRSIYDFLNFQF